MARGTLVISSVAENGGDPPSYTLTVGSISNTLIAGDHLGARLEDGSGAIYVIDEIVDDVTIIVVDELIEAEAAVFGPPAVGIAGFGTPETTGGFTQLPYNAPGWDAMHRRNIKLIALGGGGGGGGGNGATGATGATGVDGFIGVDGEAGATGATGPAGPLVGLSGILEQGGDTGGYNITVSSGDQIIGETDLVVTAGNDINISATADIVLAANGSGSILLNQIGQLILASEFSGVDIDSIIAAINGLRSGAAPVSKTILQLDVTGTTLLTSLESGMVIKSVGGAEAQLPSADLGLWYILCADSDDVFTIVPSGTETITISDSAAVNYVWAETKGSCLILVAMDNDNWSTISVVGEWFTANV